MGYARENIKDRLKPVRRLSDDLCFPKTNRGQSPRYGWVNASTIFKTPPLKIQKYLNLLLQRPQVFRRRLRSSESLKQWYGLRRQKTRACVPHTPYTSVLKFVLPTGRVCGVATHAVSRDSGYGLLPMPSFPRRRKSIFESQQPFCKHLISDLQRSVGFARG